MKIFGYEPAAWAGLLQGVLGENDGGTPCFAVAVLASAAVSDEGAARLIQPDAVGAKRCNLFHEFRDVRRRAS